MSSLEIGYLVIAVGVSGLFMVLGVLANRFFRDRIFAGLTPGLVPPLGQTAPVVKVGPGREYSGPVAVSFSPPKGLRPGLVGTIVDGTADMRDITATIVDLAVRGWFRLEAVEAPQKRKKDAKQQKSRDWRISLGTGPAPDDQLNQVERNLVSSFNSIPGAAGRGVLMSEWIGLRRDGFRQAQESLYRETVDMKWYDKSPQATGTGCLATLGGILLGAYCLLMMVSSFSLVTVGCAVLLIGSAIFLNKRLKRRVPRTALGTAAMVQAQGFKRYLATAEADQFSFEEAAGIFSRYLPYALVFGVAEHWGKVFGEVARRNQAAGGSADFDDFSWLGLGIDGIHAIALLADGIGSLGDIGDIVGGVGDMADGLGGVVEGIGDFFSGFDL